MLLLCIVLLVDICFSLSVSLSLSIFQSLALSVYLSIYLSISPSQCLSFEKKKKIDTDLERLGFRNMSRECGLAPHGTGEDIGGCVREKYYVVE